MNESTDGSLRMIGHHAATEHLAAIALALAAKGAGVSPDQLSGLIEKSRARLGSSIALSMSPELDQEATQVMFDAFNETFEMTTLAAINVLTELT